MSDFKDIVTKAFKDYQNGDSRMFDLIVKCLEESDAAKQLLRDKGYGVTGQSILRTAEEVSAVSQCCMGWGER